MSTYKYVSLLLFQDVWSNTRNKMYHTWPSSHMSSSSTSRSYVTISSHMTATTTFHPFTYDHLVQTTTHRSHVTPFKHDQPVHTTKAWFISSQSHNLGGRRGHPSLSSAALREFPNPIPSIPWCYLPISSSVFLLLSLSPAELSLPCQRILSFGHSIWVSFFIMVRRSSWTPIAFWILLRTSSFVTWSLWEMFRSLL